MSSSAAVFEAAMSDDSITITLARAEALVLFEWLAALGDSPESSRPVGLHEQRVLWKLENLLESTLPEPLDPEYDRLLAEARARVVAAEPDNP